ncbi:hypothetical protein GUITHDRAFT_156769 [Guillardia theta CCMP2712]|uniref:Pseudouridine synthase n=1 Tax=Guillardia theta (strain CCMP2712) TaxID=905079 RepID=L1K4C6_GUITC|nr:hypothetical protein GUITHDRAFT_156769 [Guillardia theta CCMP2712]EKX55295.1 hypothetical protein GUITHDRAFT_156769 [Guillardia theta CCMP2712]|eukprot:XP_005842275.1 hypothetical protein GUITHDRAFT_156769 [Guillardia theta CCMP2712]
MTQVTVCITNEERSSERLDTFLSKRISILSRSSLNRMIKAECVLVDGKTPKPAQKLKAGQTVVVNLPPPPGNDMPPEDIPLAVIHEDEDVIVINKQSDLVVHPCPTAPNGTLVNALAWHFMHRSSGSLSQVGAENARPGIVHRLDRNTTGVMVAAKTEFAHWSLYEQFALRSTRKRYIALVHGEVVEDSGLIDLPISRHPYDPIKGGKASQTGFVVRERYEGFTLVELKLFTGRTHQIRVHLSHLRHPIVGDEVYGGRKLKLLIERQALHSCLLSFSHPTSGKRMSFSGAAPEDMARTIRLLREFRMVSSGGGGGGEAEVDLSVVFGEEALEREEAS